MRDIFRAPNFRLPEAVGLVFGVDHLNSSIIFSGKKKKNHFCLERNSYLPKVISAS